jgi:hypothetical protein
MFSPLTIKKLGGGGRRGGHKIKDNSLATSARICFHEVKKHSNITSTVSTIRSAGPKERSSQNGNKILIT